MVKEQNKDEQNNQGQELEVETAFVLYQRKNGEMSFMENRFTKIGNLKLQRQASSEDAYRIICEMKARIERSMQMELLEQVLDIREQAKRSGIIKTPGGVN